jgi:hypothetical protein
MSRAFMRKRNTFRPTDIGGCQLWLDGADPLGNNSVPANGTTLTTWKDKSVSNFPFTSIGSSYSTTAVNGRPGIDIGTNFFGYDPGSAQNNWQEVFALGLWTGGSTFDTFNGLVTSSKTSDGGIQGGILFIGTAASSNWWNPGNTYVQQFVNGTQTNVAFPAIQNPFITRTYSVTAVNLQGLRFGIDREITDRKWIGYISEVISYNTPLSTTQRQQVEAYLAQKWGVRQQIPQYHPGTTAIVYSQQSIPFAISLPYPYTITPLLIQPGSCQLWLDGADPAGTGTPPSNGATVSTWVDKSTAKNAAATGSPTYVSGGGINFNGSSYFSNLSFAQNLSQRSIFIVMQETVHNNYFGVFPLIPNPTSGSDYLTANGLSIETTNGLYFFGQNSFYASALGNTSLLVKAVYNDNMDGTAGSGFLNGNSVTNNTASYTAGTCAGYGVGSRWLGSMQASYCLNGVIFEIIYYNTPLATPQRLQVEGYLAWKWGLRANLPPTHPYKNVRPGDNVLGISRPANVLPIPSIALYPTPKGVVQVLISSGLLARYRMNESAGSTVIDSIAGNNITIGGSPSRISTSYGTYTGYALSIQTATQYGSATLPDNMVVGAHSMTSWVYFTGFPSGTATVWVGWGSECKGENHAYYNDNASISTIFGGPSCIYGLNFLDNNTNTVSPQLNTWYFCVTTWDGNTTWKTYCYSPTTAYAFTFSFGMNAVVSGGVFGIGISNALNGQFGGTGYGGYLGEIRFYNRVLTATEVASIYAGTG